MSSFQVILIVLSVLGAILGSVAFRSRLSYRLLALLFFLVAIAFTMFPDATTTVARLFGVGRGTDLILYLLVFAGIHSFLLLCIRLRRLERKLTAGIRELAIAQAEQ